MPEIEASEKKIDVLDWPKVRFIIFISAAIFVFTIAFMNASSDIKDYVYDHRMMDYDWIEFFLILAFIIVFYAFPMCCLSYFRLKLPKIISNSKWNYLILGLPFSILAIICLSYIVLPWIVGQINSPELEGLRRTVLIWLFSILFINILLDHSPFEEPATERIEKGWRSFFKK